MTFSNNFLARNLHFDSQFFPINLCRINVFNIPRTFEAGTAIFKFTFFFTHASWSILMIFLSFFIPSRQHLIFFFAFIIIIVEADSMLHPTINKCTLLCIMYYYYYYYCWQNVCFLSLCVCWVELQFDSTKNGINICCFSGLCKQAVLLTLLDSSFIFQTVIVDG